MLCLRRSAALFAFSAAALAGAPGCRGVVLDLGTQKGSECPEVVVGADLTHTDFGASPGADCVRFFAQIAADVDQAMYALELDVGLACDGIATGGGEPVSASPGVRSRCDAAIAALATSLAYTTMGPFAPFIDDPGACTPGPVIACGACEGLCDEAQSANARASCAAPAFRLVATRTPVNQEALDTLRLELALVLPLTGARGDAQQRLLDDILASISRATAGAHLDLRGAVCMERAASLVTEAIAHFSAARSEADRLLDDGLANSKK
jgi:hypothetical protein